MASLEEPIRITELPEATKMIQDDPGVDHSDVSFPKGSMEIKTEVLPGVIHVVDFTKVKTADESNLLLGEYTLLRKHRSLVDFNRRRQYGSYGRRR